MAKKKKKKKKSKVECGAMSLEQIESLLDDENEAVSRDDFEIDTGILPLDLILSKKGGLSSGSVELWGPEGAGKSSFALSVVRSAKKLGLQVMYVDAEFRMTDDLCEIFGLEAGRDFMLRQPDNAENALNDAEKFLKLTKNAIVVIDSIPALISSAELETGVDGKLFNPVSIMLSNFAKRAQRLCRQNQSILIYLNQTRANLEKYGSKTKVPGPAAVRYKCSWRIEAKPIGRLRESGEDGEIIGHKVQFQTVKSLKSKPFQKATSCLIYGMGFHRGFDLITLVKELGRSDLIKVSGSWFEFCDEQKIQGINSAAAKLAEDDDLYDKIRRSTLKDLVE